MAKKNYVSVDVDFLENSIVNLKDINILGLITADQGESYAFNGSPQEVATSADHIIATEDSVWLKSTSQTQNTVLAAPSSQNGAATFRALTAADMPKTTAIADSKLLFSGQTVDAAIANAGFSNSTNLLNSGYNVAIRANSSNPFIGLKEGSNLWYAQASSGYFYFGPTSTKALRLDQNGNGVFQTGSVTATAIIKKDGTSSQFLKADGSVDSNTYALASSLSSYLPLSGGTMTGAIQWDDGEQIMDLGGSLFIASPTLYVFSNNSIVRVTEEEGDFGPSYTVFDSGNLTFDNSNNLLSITAGSNVYTAAGTGYVSNAISTALADYTPTANFAKLTVYSGVGLGDTNVLEYTPAGAANLYIEYDKNGAVELTANGTSHKITVNHKTQGPNTSGNTTISDSTGKVLSAITVNKFGHVTSVAQKTLAAADIPNIAISQVTNLQTSLDAKADDTDLNNYLDLAGTHIMTGPLQWDNHSIHPDNNAGFFFDIGTSILMTSDSGTGEIKFNAAEYYFDSGLIYHTVSGNDYELIDEHNFPTLWGNAYNANGINGALTFGVNTGSPTQTAHLEVVRVNGVDYLHSRLPFYSDGDVSGFGANGSGGGGGDGKIQTVYTTSDFGTISSSHQAYETETFNAYAVDTLYNRLVTAEGDIDSLETAIGSLVGFEARVVTSLPQTGDVGIIYLVSHNHGTGDVYDEYIWVSSTSSYEKIGNTDIDLSQYINSVSFASGSSAGTGKAITNFTKSNNSLTFTTGTFLTGITSSMVTTALGFTPFDAANFTKANIKSTLGISDWALASTKPSYKISEIGTGDLTSNGFLKRNGSSWTVDTNTYLTSAALSGYVNSLINETSASGKYVKNVTKDGSTLTVTYDTLPALPTDYWHTGDTRTANTVLAAPNNSNGPATFRALVETDLPTISWEKISSTGRPTTLAGYGITDAKIQNGTITLGSNTITPLTSHQSLDGYVNTLISAGGAAGKYVSDVTKDGSSLSVSFTNFPTSLAGYGIQDSIPIIDTQDNGTSAAGTWEAKTTPASLITAYTDGMMIRYKLTHAGASTTTLNVNGLGAKNVYRRGTSKLTTQYGVGSYLILYYSTTFNNGSWQVLTDYDSTYSVISDSELQTGTATTGRTISAARLAANYYISNGTVHIAGNSITPLTADSNLSWDKLNVPTNVANLAQVPVPTTGAKNRYVYDATNTVWTFDNADYLTTSDASSTYQPLNGILTSLSNITSQSPGMIAVDSNGNISTVTTSSVAHFGTEGSDYVAISLNGTSKNVLTQHQDLSAYLQKSALNIIDAGSSTGEYISGITWSSSNSALSVSRGSLSGYLTSSTAASTYLAKSGGTMTGNISWSDGYVGEKQEALWLTSQNNVYVTSDSDIVIATDDIAQGTNICIYSGANVEVTGSSFTFNGDSVLTSTTAASTYQPLDADLTAIVGLTGTSGFLKKTAANTWSLDTSTYLTTSAASSTYLTQTSASNTYLPLTGGTLTGPLHVKTTSTNALSGTDGYIDFTNGSSTIYSRIGTNTSGTIALYGSGNIYLRPNDTVGELSSSYGVSISPTAFTYNGNNVVLAETDQYISGTKTFSGGTLIVSTATSGSPSIWLTRGTTSDNYIDYGIRNISGAFTIQARYTPSGGTAAVQPTAIQIYRDNYTSELRIFGLTDSTGDSTQPTLALIRKGVSDGYTDWKIRNDGGALKFVRSLSGTDTDKIAMNDTQFHPSVTEQMYFGSASYRWLNVYSVDANLSGTLTVDSISVNSGLFTSGLTVGTTTDNAATTLNGALNVNGTTTLNGSINISKGYSLNFLAADGVSIANYLSLERNGGYLSIGGNIVFSGGSTFSIGSSSTAATSIDLYGPTIFHNDITIPYGQKIKFEKPTSGATAIELYCDSAGVLHTNDTFTSEKDISGFTAAGSTGGTTTFIKAEVVPSVPQSPDPNTLYLIPE